MPSFNFQGYVLINSWVVAACIGALENWPRMCGASGRKPALHYNKTKEFCNDMPWGHLPYQLHTAYARSKR